MAGRTYLKYGRELKTSLLTMIALILILVLAGFIVAYALLRLWLGLPILPEMTLQGEDSSEAIASSLPSEDVPGAEHIVRAYETIEQPHPVLILETLTGATLAYLIDNGYRVYPCAM